MWGVHRACHIIIINFIDDNMCCHGSKGCLCTHFTAIRLPNELCLAGMEQNHSVLRILNSAGQD